MIDTLGSTLSDTGSGGNDTEIGLYDFAGNRIAENDDYNFTAGIDRENRLSFGADPMGAGSGDLPSGEYFIAVGAFDTTFNATAFDVTSTSTATGTALVNFNNHLEPVTIDIGILPEGTLTATGESLIPQEVFFYYFELFEPINATDGDYLVIDTLGSTLSDTGSGGNDTEIGLYDFAGNLIAENDDFIPGDPANRWSRLSFGADPMAAGSGDLASGGYFLAIGAFNTTFNATAFNVASTSTATGDIVVNLYLLNASRASKPVCGCIGRGFDGGCERW